VLASAHGAYRWCGLSNWRALAIVVASPVVVNSVLAKIEFRSRKRNTDTLRLSPSAWYECPAPPDCHWLAK
jgi:hypothetical protein